MSVPARLAAYVAALALGFGRAAFAGSRIDAHPGTPVGDRTMAGGHDAHATTDADTVRGLAVSDGGQTLRLARTTAPQGRPTTLAFTIVDDATGRPVRAFDETHERRMHLIVVRRDLTGFQHLHPRMRADGTWTAPVTLPAAGTYRVFADYATGGTPRTLAADLTVDGTATTAPLPAPARTASADGLDVRLTGATPTAGTPATLSFAVTRGGRPVALQPYLGARGHLVALRRGDLAFLHVHPEEHALTFAATFPTAGAYRLFLQVRTGGAVHTIPFTLEVGR
jgi:hypothetical protein